MHNSWQTMVRCLSDGELALPLQTLNLMVRSPLQAVRESLLFAVASPPVFLLTPFRNAVPTVFTKFSRRRLERGVLRYYFRTPEQWRWKSFHLIPFISYPPHRHLLPSCSMDELTINLSRRKATSKRDKPIRGSKRGSKTPGATATAYPIRNTGDSDAIERR
jgi:hypothetical protein